MLTTEHGHSDGVRYLETLTVVQIWRQWGSKVFVATALPLVKGTEDQLDNFAAAFSLNTSAGRGINRVLSSGRHAI